MDTEMTLDEIRGLKSGDAIRCGNFNYTVIEFDPFWDNLTYRDKFGNRACYSANACVGFGFSKGWV